MKADTIQSVTRPEHWAAFSQLLQEYAANDLDQAHLSTIWKDLEDLPARYGPPHGGALLLQRDDQALACGAFASTRISDLCEIKRIYVRPAFRTQGLAQRIFQALLEAALQAGYTHAALSTWRHNIQGFA
jgi:GNAT superfamily N-acetyltransferase